MPTNQNLAWLTVTILTLTYATLQQEYNSAVTLTLSTAFFTLTYAILRQTRLFHPKQIDAFSDAMESEWRSRIVSILHAIILTIGSLLCFYDWRYLSHEDAWSVITKDATTTYDGTFYPVFFAAIFGGFLQYDICWILYHFNTYADYSALLHHTLFLAVTHYNLTAKVFCRPFAWLSVAELSTPFLHIRWYYAVRGWKDDGMYVLVSSLFAGTFLLTRVGGYTWGLWDLWVSGRDVWMTNTTSGAFYVVAAIHVGYAMNLFWGWKVVKALERALRSRGGEVGTETATKMKKVVMEEKKSK